MSVLSERSHKARSKHRCDSCNEIIDKGTIYISQFNAEGGESWTYKAHTACLKAGQTLFKLGHEGMEDAIINVFDMEHEHRELIRENNHDVFAAIWPDAVWPNRKETQV